LQHRRRVWSDGAAHPPARARRAQARVATRITRSSQFAVRSSQFDMIARMSIHIRPLTTLEDCRKVAELEKLVWGYTDAEHVVPPPVLTVAIKRGGVLLGAFDGSGEMKGFVYSMPAMKDGRPTQWSHMLGVTADARSAGLGAELKLAQREHTLGMGID